jgi:hypothetical protein
MTMCRNTIPKIGQIGQTGVSGRIRIADRPERSPFAGWRRPVKPMLPQWTVIG